MQSKRILLAGEPMALFLAQTPGPLEAADSYRCAIAGAEYNVAVGLARLGHRVDYLTVLGRDPFGRRIARALQAEGIGCGLLRWSDDRRTGFMLKGLAEQGDPDIFYYRAGSAASTLCPADVERLELSAYDHIHLTGITPALSPSCREAVLLLARRAREAGISLSFDPNLRPQLWPDADIMRNTIHTLAALCDIFLPGAGESRTLCGAGDAAAAAAYYCAAGTPCVIVKAGPGGACWQAGADGGFVPGFAVPRVVDTVGAGDGFAAGVISARLEGLDWPACVARGNAIGAIQVMNRGDNEGLPTRPELEDFLAGRGRYFA